MSLDNLAEEFKKYILTFNVFPIAAIIILLGSVFLRIWHLSFIPGINGDEAFLGAHAYDVSHGIPFSWRTPTGNIENPFSFLPLILVHKILAPSALSLRIVSLISGILIIPSNYLLCRKVYGKSTAVVSTLLLAVLPVNIIYSRFGWEPCQSVLFSIFLIYGTLLLINNKQNIIYKITILGALAFSVVLVHPTNVFLLIIVTSALLALIIKPESFPLRTYLFCVLCVFFTAILGILAVQFAPTAAHLEIGSRLWHHSWQNDWWSFILAWMRVYNGINSLTYITGTWPLARDLADGLRCPHVYWADAFALVAMITSALFILNNSFKFHQHEMKDVSSIISLERRKDLVLITGTLASLILFHILNGPQKIAVDNERYILWSVLPGVLILSRGIVIICDRFPKKIPFLKTLGVLTLGLLLWQTAFNYFVYPLKYGSQSHFCFRIGKNQLSQEATGKIIQLSYKMGAICIVSSDYFVYYPLAYFLKSYPETFNIRSFYVWLPFLDHEENQRWMKEIKRGKTVFIEYSNSKAWEQWDKLIQKNNLPYNSLEISDVAGRPTILIKTPSVSSK